MFSAPCHFHPATQKVLGTLDIGLSQEHLQKALAKMKVQMTVFTLLTLILTVGGVSALLLRSVFLPIRKLDDFTSRLASGATNAELPPFPEDLDRVARTVYKMAHRNATPAREREEGGGVSKA